FFETVLSRSGTNPPILFRIICRHWKNLIENHRCFPLKSLKLFGSKRDVDRYAHDLFQYDFAQSDFQLIKDGNGHDHDFVLSAWSRPTDLKASIEVGQFFLQHLVIYTRDLHLLKDSTLPSYSSDGFLTSLSAESADVWGE